MTVTPPRHDANMLLQTSCAGCSRPGYPLCRTCRFALVCPPGGRRHQPLGPDGIIAAVPFSGRSRDVILGFKYRNRRAVAAHLAGLLVNRILGAGLQPGVDFDVVTWAPTSAARRRARGFDQAELVARRVALQMGLPVRQLLVRRSATSPQTGAGRTERLAGPRFGVHPRAAGARVLIVDDVVTTGSTLGNASRALGAAGAISVIRTAVAATPAGVHGRQQRWGRVVVGPWPTAPVAFAAHGHPGSNPPRRRRQETQSTASDGARHQRLGA